MLIEHILMSSEIKCSLCQAHNVNKATCPLNLESLHPDFEKHNVAAKKDVKDVKVRSSLNVKAITFKTPTQKAYETRSAAYFNSFAQQKEQSLEDVPLMLLLKDLNKENLKPILKEFKLSIKYANLPNVSFHSILHKHFGQGNKFFIERNPYIVRMQKTTVDNIWIDPSMYTLSVLNQLKSKLINDDVLMHLPTVKFYLKDQPALDAGGVLRIMFNNMSDYFKNVCLLQDAIYYPCGKSGEMLNLETKDGLATLIVMSLLTNTVIDLPLPLELYELIVTSIYSQLFRTGNYKNPFNINLYKLLYLMKMKYPKESDVLLNMIAMDEAEEYISTHYQSNQGPDDKGPTRLAGRIIPREYNDESIKFLPTDKFQWYYDILMRNVYYIKPEFSRIPFTQEFSPIAISYFEIADNVAHLLLRLPPIAECLSKNQDTFTYKVFAHHLNSSVNLTIEQMMSFVDNMRIPAGNNIKDFMIHFIRINNPETWKNLIKYITGTIDPYAIVTVKAGRLNSIPTASTCDKSITLDLENTRYEVFADKLKIALDNATAAFGFS